jgi:hypothetical protein
VFRDVTSEPGVVGASCEGSSSAAKQVRDTPRGPLATVDRPTARSSGRAVRAADRERWASLETVSTVLYVYH